MQSRRQFLINASALALTACSGLSISQIAGAKQPKRRYIVCTPSKYWGIAQERFVKFKPNKKLPGPSSDMSTVVTVVNDDGSNLHQLFVPASIHSALSIAEKNLIYLVGVSQHNPSKIFALNATTLEPVSSVISSNDSDARIFSGHGVTIPGTDSVAFGIRSNREGKHDFISIRDALTLKEIQSYSSFGFDLHEVRLSQDAKYFVCGHYGSYLGQGTYASLRTYSSGKYYGKEPQYHYPSSVIFVDVKSGKRFKLLSDINSGELGHADSDELYNAYICNRRTKLITRPNLEEHFRFREGKQTTPDNGEFKPTATMMGISLRYDPKYQEVIVPDRPALKVIVTNTKTREQKEVDFSRQLNWKPETPHFISGLEFHPDGKHYIMSTSQGFIAMERGSHKFNPAMTFRLPLLIHSHMHII